LKRKPNRKLQNIKALQQLLLQGFIFKGCGADGNDLISFDLTLSSTGGRPLRNCPVDNFREQPDCRGGGNNLFDGINLLLVGWTLSSTGDLAKKTKMMLKHHLTYFNLSVYVSELPTTPY